MLTSPAEAVHGWHTPAKDASPEVGLNGVRVLLAEDGPDNQRLIAAVLQRAGAEVTVAENGRIAVDKAIAAGDEGFDAILMDMQMPEMDGYEATEMLREKGLTCPIIALTAHAMSGDRERCLSAGCTDYCTKPINRSSLVAILARHTKPEGTDADEDGCHVGLFA